MKRRLVSASVAGLALIGLGSVPANALVGGSMAGHGQPADAVVRLTLPAQPGYVSSCTGTAISSQWVITASHCIANGVEPGGKVTVGQGSNTQDYKINDWRVAPEGDMALIHVENPIALNAFPQWDQAGEITDQNKPATVYGWSQLGMGRSGNLPQASVEARRCPAENYPCADSVEFFSHMAAPAALQHGDSGGPIFIDGKLVGVLSGAVTFNVSWLTGMYSYTGTSGLKDWINGQLGTNPTQPGVDVSTDEPVAQIPLPIEPADPQVSVPSPNPAPEGNRGGLSPSLSPSL